LTWIVALVGRTKRTGVDAVRATPLAVGFGLAISVGYVVAEQVPGSEVALRCGSGP
jgi:hypothetical protein